MTRGLSRIQCLRLLNTAAVGRVIVYHHSFPVVRPVPFRLFGDHILMPVRPGGRIATAAQSHAVLALQADRLDSAGIAGWSVVVTGIADVINSDLAGAHGHGSWVPRGRSTLLRLPVEDVIGRCGSVLWG